MRELAARAGIGVASVSELERGKYPARPTTLAALAGVLGCEIADLMADEPDGNAA